MKLFAERTDIVAARAADFKEIFCGDRRRGVVDFGLKLSILFQYPVLDSLS
jgi:hypothetical protein